MRRSNKILVWDLPTRVFHWLLAGSFAGAFLTAGSTRWLDVHVALGYTILGLIAFRLLWGLIGTRYARFSSYAFGARSVVGYLTSLFTRSPRHYVGHNPAASWAIYGLLALSLAVGLSGYATYSNIGGHSVKELHEGLASALLALVVVHIAGVLVSSLIHRENLVRSMIDGMKHGNTRSGIRQRHRMVAAALVLAVAVSWVGGSRYFDVAPGTVASAAVIASRHNDHEEHRHHD